MKKIDLINDILAPIFIVLNVIIICICFQYDYIAFSFLYSVLLALAIAFFVENAVKKHNNCDDKNGYKYINTQAEKLEKLCKEN